ncbi:MAG TPA: HTH domain-containing protein [Pseudonocardia sp.]|nr:HTH domain-containing protein [Pseudonocardia sp.]
MKSAGPAVPVDVRPSEAPSTGEGRTREAVARLLMEQGPVTAAAVAAELELSGPAVRRHLDALLADGEAEVRDAPRRGRRGRGRPAREYLLTDAGRARFGHGYDELAVAALHYLAEHGGESAVRGFARSRVEALLGGGAQQVSAAHRPDERAAALADLLTSRGYAAQARASHAGVQLCQHHCPVAHVAAAFPELCEAETQAFAALLGTHVQRLATIARGDSACTTHVPLDAPDVRRKHDTTTTPAGRQPE